MGTEISTKDEHPRVHPSFAVGGEEKRGYRVPNIFCFFLKKSTEGTVLAGFLITSFAVGGEENRGDIVCRTFSVYTKEEYGWDGARWISYNDIRKE